MNSLLIAAMLFMAAGVATAGLSLVQSSACMGCHMIVRIIIGPSWWEVARKCKGDFTVEALLMKVISKGGRGLGCDPDAARPHVSETDARKLACSIQSL